MKIKLNNALVVVFVVLVLALGALPAPTQAAPLAIGGIGLSCQVSGGVWEGPDYQNGTCTFTNETHPNFSILCAANFSVVVFNVINDAPTGFVCTGGAPYGKAGSAVDGEGGSTTIALKGRNGSVAFDAGACAGKCTVGPNLPGGAKDDLPADATDTLYVRVIGEDGEPGTGTYTVCFAVGDLTSPVIYRYVGGAWVAQSVTFSGGQVCTSGSGDGAFALGGS